MGNCGARAKLYRPKKYDFDLTDGELAHLQDLYDDEIRYLDARLGELFASLEASGALQRTMVVLVADHGVEFLEHRHVKHCHRRSTRRSWRWMTRSSTRTFSWKS